MRKPLFGEPKSSMENDNKYSRLVDIPQYKPSDKKPPIEALYSCEKYGKLIQQINNSTVSEEEKKFLRHSASRHIVFNYAQIADYYANATPEMQELMEQSGLVILDIDDAIAGGYVKLSKRLEEIRKDGKLAQRARDFE